jgi:vancomycin resistance protein YoaR
MAKRRWVISIMVLVCLLGLVGCAEKTEKVGALEKKVADLEKQVEKEKEKATKKELEEQKPILVNVIDPTTKAIIKTFQPKEMGYPTDQEKYKAEVEKWAQELARGTETTPGYDKRMIPDRIDANGQVVKGSPRTILEETELAKRIIEASAKGGDVELPLYVTASGYKPEDVAQLGEVVVASFTTYFGTGAAGRTKNIELSAQAIHNVIVGTDDIFSFNTTVGPSDEAHGYQPAQEAINGELVMGIGGGICQTSSTLFNAIDQLGVTYVEKHHHSVTVGYVPKGRDATVSYGGKDFRFQNTTGVPLLITSVFQKGKLTIEIRTSTLYQGMVKKAV